MQAQMWTTPLRQPTVRLSVLLLCMLLPCSSAWAQKNYYMFSFAIGGVVNAPQGVAIDAEDNLYVADTNNNRIVKFEYNPANNDYNFVGKIGSTGSGSGQFNNPTAVAVDRAGNIYVADSSNNRIQKFDITGTYITQFGSYGTGNKQFQHPTGVAVDGSGSVYVADTDNNRVQKFDSSGHYITQFGTKGSGNTNFLNPVAVAVDSTGNIYVLDRGNNALKQFNSAGTWIWTVGGFSAPRGLTLDASTGYVDVADTGNGVIKQYDSNGNFITQIGGFGDGNGGFANPYGVAVNGYGDFFVTDIGNAPYYPYSYHNRIEQFDSFGNYLNQFGTPGYTFNNPHGVGVDSQGIISVADTSDSRVMQFDNQGNYHGVFGGLGEGNGQFAYPYALALDNSGDIFVTDTGQYPNYPYDDHDRVEKFDSQDNYLFQFGSQGTGNGQFSNPAGVALDSSGNIYVADNGNNRIQKFDSNGNYLFQFGSQGTGNGQFQYPTGVAVDSSGNIYVTDTGNDRIEKFDKTGKFKWAVGSYGTKTGQFESPAGIAVDSSADVYVADTGNHRLQKFDTNGNFITEFSADVWGDAYASAVSGVAVDTAGSVYVTDITNSRMVKLVALASVAPTLTSLSPNQATVGSPNITLTVNGTNFLSGAVVNFGTSKLKTSFVSSTQLIATILASQLTSVNTVDVTVTNPGGGGTSNGLAFSIVNSVPTLTGITPDQVAAGSGDTKITLKGTHFVSNSTVMFGNTVLTSKYVSTTQLTATIPAAQLTTAEVVNVSVTNPTPGGGESNILTFVVGTNPVPSVSSLSPNQVVVGSPATTLTVNGANFINGATIRFNGNALATTFISDSQLMATLSAGQLATVGEFNVNVNNPKPGGGNSGALTFTVANPTPVLSSISPAQVTVGTGATTLTLTGSGFTSGSTAQFNGTSLTTTYVSTTQLTAVIPASQLTVPGNFNITVVNSAPGGGTSGSCTFSVLNGVPTLSSLSPSQAKAGSAAITLTLTGTDFIKGATVSFGGTTLGGTTVVSSTKLTATVSSTLLKKVGSFAVVVTNPAPGGGDSNSLTFTVN